MKQGWIIVVAAWLITAAAGVRTTAQDGYTWTLPRGVPPPTVPAGNPMSEAKVALGRHLFYDTRLSGNRTREDVGRESSCAAVWCVAPVLRRLKGGSY